MNSDAAGRPQSVHRPVLPREVLRSLELQPGLTVVDGTLGAAGHSRLILEHIQPDGILIGVDRDPMMVELARQKLSEFDCRLVQENYAHLPSIIEQLGIDQVDRILVDLGLSSDQLADRQRGFGILAGGPLDLRFDPGSGQPASDLLAAASADELQRIFSEFGEEPQAAAIAQRIVNRRRSDPVRTAEQLAQLVTEVVGQRGHRHGATRVFQALRIAVNAELEHVEHALRETFPAVLRPGGLCAVITFHSLEDRITKRAFLENSIWQSVTAKPVTATSAEIRLNPRSRSAKLRVARRIKT